MVRRVVRVVELRKKEKKRGDLMISFFSLPSFFLNRDISLGPSVCTILTKNLKAIRPLYAEGGFGLHESGEVRDFMERLVPESGFGGRKPIVGVRGRKPRVGV